MEEIINQVEEQDIMQVITNNGLRYKATEEILIE